MPSITTVHESLPYIDSEPTPAERAAAEALIAMERSTIPDDPHHALLPTPLHPSFTPFIQAELDRIAAAESQQQHQQQSHHQQQQQPPRSKAIDMSRYQSAPDVDTATATHEDLEPALNQAHTALTYLTARRQHLALLDSYGKNQWLVGNWQLEAELRAVERELADARREIDLLTVRRQRMQGEVGSELRGLEENWRRGVGRVLETEVAAEGVRREVLEMERRRAAGGR